MSNITTSVPPTDSSHALSTIELVTTDYCHVKARARTSIALFELREYDWRNLREAALIPPSSYVELTTIRSKGRHHLHPTDKWQDLGHLRFLPAGMEFESRWHDKNQRSLCCAFDNYQASKFGLRIDDERLLSAYDMQNQQLFNLLKRTWQEIENPGLACDVILESLSLAIFEALTEELANPNQNNVQRIRGSRLGNHETNKIIARIRESRCQPTVKDLACEAGVSMRHFSRLFHASTGLSISEVCKQARFDRAKSLLETSTLLIKEVAYQCGFNNSASFCKAFRASAGSTPQAYRNARLSH